MTLWVDDPRSRWPLPATRRARRRPTGRGCWRWRWRCCCCAAASGWGWRATRIRRARAGRSSTAAGAGAGGRGRRRTTARPMPTGMVAHGRAVFLSDFLGDLAAVEAALAQASDRGVRGVLVQVLDPAEEEFPFDGRTIFESMGGTLRHETQRAGDLRGALSGAAGRAQGPAGDAGPRLGLACTSAITPATAGAGGAAVALPRAGAGRADVDARPHRLHRALAAAGADRAADPVAACCAPCRPRRSGGGFPAWRCCWA